MRMVDNYFVFNGMHSDEIGVHVLKLPSITRAAERIENITIPGRSGNLHEHEGAYDSYTKSVECLLKKGADVDKVAATLRGSGEIILSNEPDKKYRVTVINQIDIAYAAMRFQNFILQLDTQPFKYSASVEDVLELTGPQRIYNPGTYYSEPIITIYGTGNVTLDINGKSYTVGNIDGHVTINAEIQEIYKNNVNKNNTYKTADFPTLDAGASDISWTGNVSKVIIQPNWRWF